MLSVKNISIAFGGNHVLNKCSLSIKKGLVTTLIGPNGSGKTTLFNVICSLLKKDFGEILISGKKIYLTPQNLSRNKIVRTFQDPILFKNLTVYQHLEISIRNRDSLIKNLLQKDKLSNDEKNKIERVLKDLKLDHKKDVRAMDLSGGQRKLLDLAMVLVKEFDIILLDEPTAGVAPSLRELLVERIKKLKKDGKTIFLIEHDMHFVMSISDEIIVLNEGKVMTKGKPNEIKNNKEVLEAYLGV